MQDSSFVSLYDFSRVYLCQSPDDQDLWNYKNNASPVKMKIDYYTKQKNDRMKGLSTINIIGNAFLNQ